MFDSVSVPRVRGTVTRDALVKLSVESAHRSTLVIAPSGYGKTVLAAQIASGSERAMWLDFDGAPFGLSTFVERVTQTLDSADPVLPALREVGGPAAVAMVAAQAPAGAVVVLDDVGLSDDTLDDLLVLSLILEQAGDRLVVTSRSSAAHDRAVRRFEIIGPEDLRMSEGEALLLVQGMGTRPFASEEIRSLWNETQGHPAFLAVMARAAARGIPSLGADARLTAWLDHLVGLLDEDQEVLLVAASILVRGRVGDITTVSRVPAASLESVAELLPLVRVESRGQLHGAGRRFFVHDLLSEYILNRVRRGTQHSELADRAFDLLLDRGDLARAAAVVDIAGESKVAGFLRASGFGALGQLAAPRVVELMDSLPLGDVLRDATLMLLWSDALLDCDMLEDALAKARAARVLADHQGRPDVAAQALSNSLDAFRLMNRWEEAADSLTEAERLLSGELPVAARIALLRSAGTMHALSGNYDLALELLEAVQACAYPENGRSRNDWREAAETAALFPCFALGDYFATARALTPWASREDGSRAQRVDSRGNLAVALVEVSRMDRASGLLGEAITLAGEVSLAYFLPVLGCAQFADGQESVGLDSISRGIATALELGAEAEAAQNRVYEAMLLRAAGRFEESLTSAERAYERLCLQDFMDFRRLAVLEVAASLLALGDTSAARAWAEPVINSGFGRNLHHEFRAAMIIAECERREGDRQAGVERLAAYADHVRSENSNFQLGMYSRAFPDLLGMVAHTVGVESLPVHLVRLITPEAAERCLRSSKDLLDPAEWAELGVRLLGAEQFAGFIERKGRPLCRVRMFGGLDITVGDRAIRERDWKKRKARQLFTMLALKRGQEVPRDVILDHLWPDLTEEKAKNNFYVAWSTMKSTLMGDEAGQGPCPYVDNAASRCRVLRDAVRSDIDEFEELIAAARNAESVGDPDGAVAAFERLASVYHGDLLPSDLYDDWFTAARERYRFEFIAAMTRMVELLLERDSPCEALVYARRALQVDPYREDLYQAALRCHIAAGQRSAAIETFVACKTQLSEELGLDPSSETVSLYEQILVMEERPRYDDFGLTVRRTDG